MEIRRVEQLTGPVDATVAVPGSKSIANRVLVCAALARGSSTLTNVPDGDDTRTMLACLRELGTGVELADGHVSLIQFLLLLKRD